jgi:hypothetical protein
MGRGEGRGPPLGPMGGPSAAGSRSRPVSPIRIITERQPCSIARLPTIKAPRLSTAAAPAPFVARLTCVRENAPHSDERAAKPRLSVLAIRFAPFTRLDAKLLPLPLLSLCRQTCARENAPHGDEHAASDQRRR